MWFFRSPEVAFGEGALDHLTNIQGSKAFIVTDGNIIGLGLADRVQSKLSEAGIETSIFGEVEPNPSLQTVRKGAEAALAFGPDLIIGLGGGSCLDAAKALYVLYERPDLQPDEIAPAGSLGLRQKSRLVAIPTTSGTGAEVTWAVVLTDTAEHRKLNLGNAEAIPDIAIVDPEFVKRLPPQITADTGMDVLTHAVEGYTSHWHNDFADGLCLQATRLVFEYLPRAYEFGAQDEEAREKMHSAATIAGLGFGNSMAASAHALGHATGALFPVPHGRAVGLYLPYTIEFCARGDLPTRYGDLARLLNLPADDQAMGAASLAAAIRQMARRIGQPTSLREAGIAAADFETALERLIDNAYNDFTLTLGLRFPDDEEIERLYRYAFEGRSIDF